MKKYDIDFHKYFEYNELSPSGLVWKARDRSDFIIEGKYLRFVNLYEGEPAGIIAKDNTGYKKWVVKIGRISYTCSKIIYCMTIGPIPEGYHIDHEDGNSLRNKKNNLRLSTCSQNQGNRKMQCNNKSGFKGVTFYKGRWRASLKGRHLGLFDSPEEAHERYMVVAKVVHGEFARSN